MRSFAGVILRNIADFQATLKNVNRTILGVVFVSKTNRHPEHASIQTKAAMSTQTKNHGNRHPDENRDPETKKIDLFFTKFRIPPPSRL